MMKLYIAPGACSLACHIALEEAGADYQTERVDLAAGQQRSPEYLKLNPKGRVPLLATDQGTLTEVAAILAYIAMAYPQAKLAPVDDPWAMAQVQSFNMYLSSTVHIAFAAIFRPARFTPDEGCAASMKETGLATIDQCLRLIDERLDGRDWVNGADYTVSDPYLLVMLRWWVRLGRNLDPYRNLPGFAERILARPAVQRVFTQEGITMG